MAWHPRIEQWRRFAVWEGKDIPPDLILAIIKHESAGIAGRLSNSATKSHEIEKADGTKITFNHAMGLTQCIPAVVAGYNKNFSEKAYFEDMTGQTERAARLQIRLGAWVLASNVHLLHKYDPILFPGSSPGSATPEQLKLALVAYGIGFGALKPKLNQLKERGRPLTIESLQQEFPMWGYSKTQGRWINRPLFGAMKKWSLYDKNAKPGKPGLQSPNNPLSLPDFPTIERAAKKIKDNWAWLLIAAALAIFWGKTKPKILNVGKATIVGRK